MDASVDGHPDQNEIAVAQFPIPIRLQSGPTAEPHPNLRRSRKRGATLPGPSGSAHWIVMQRCAQRKGRQPARGYMEYLATTHLSLMIAQRFCTNQSARQMASPSNIFSAGGRLFDEEMASSKRPAAEIDRKAATTPRARRIAEE